jgi:hypothetical protein
MPASLARADGLTRRRLLTTGGAATAAAVVALQPRLARAAVLAVGQDPAYLRRSSYGSLVGQGFKVTWWVGSATLTLDGVADIGTPDMAGRDDAFALEFSGAQLAPLQNGTTVSFSHPKLGAFQLFVTPVDRTDGSQHYEAVVNRSVGVTRVNPAPRPPRTGGKPPTPVPHPPQLPLSLVRHASARRSREGLTCRVALSEHAHAKRIHAWLMRDGRVVAISNSPAVHDHRALLRFRTTKWLGRGGYVLVVAMGMGPKAVLVPVRVKLG